MRWQNYHRYDNASSFEEIKPKLIVAGASAFARQRIFNRATCTVENIDPELSAAIESEKRRPEEHIELIAFMPTDTLRFPLRVISSMATRHVLTDAPKQGFYAAI
ncbi:hypothetical protein BN2476_140079 [Paraburkholderia piptadeniae]|uniref:Uncharacterized protein n=1 Tax=Paraburkholderia piptadeniae TaxID=1701573 RepID=A0A1N7RS62_9BURK|nr:hypothetical protein [Paraburkholderia piptadeniae]SIT37906.1 hypothetical protein BN2476_140079 [Paraburkholderia piptadeniae]